MYLTYLLQYIINFICRFLTGNPCSNYEGYKEYVIASLPRLKVSDFLSNFNCVTDLVGRLDGDTCQQAIEIGGGGGGGHFRVYSSELYHTLFPLQI